ncbi:MULTISPECIES: hypothetical protein [unclassified Sphingobacterium]|uniref:hypothetical protein n=1 Tax=unclassified Sphingobacterium TaxID=2609468 RepID=UPI0025FBB69D|nr:MULTISPECIES: hypothetical protein [unclassified Sphingobacterium]
MSIISKETEIQERLSSVYDALKSTKEQLRNELSVLRERYEDACLHHIESGFQKEQVWIQESDNHHRKYLEYDIHNFLLDIISDYRDLDGYFPEYSLMVNNIEELMFAYVNEEKYEVAAILKQWLTRFQTIDSI